MGDLDVAGDLDEAGKLCGREKTDVVEMSNGEIGGDNSGDIVEVADCAGVECVGVEVQGVENAGEFAGPEVGCAAIDEAAEWRSYLVR